MRTLVDLPDQQISLLKKVCTSENISRAEAIRRAITQYLAQHTKTEVNALGLWDQHGEKIDGLEYQQQIRNQW